MKNSILACLTKTLAVALCLAIPGSATAAPTARAIAGSSFRSAPARGSASKAPQLHLQKLSGISLPVSRVETARTSRTPVPSVMASASGPSVSQSSIDSTRGGTPEVSRASGKIPLFLEKMRAGFHKLSRSGPGSEGPDGGQDPADDASRVSASEAYSPFVPSSKKVVSLQLLAQKDPEAGFKAAAAILRDKSERRVEVKVSALRVIDAMPPARLAPILAEVVEGDTNWYIKREAARMLGVKASSLTAGLKEAKAALIGAVKSTNSSLQLMGQWALTQMGVEPPAIPQAKAPPVETQRPSYKEYEDDAVRYTVVREKMPASTWLIPLAIMATLIGIAVFKTPQAPSLAKSVQSPAAITRSVARDASAPAVFGPEMAPSARTIAPAKAPAPVLGPAEQTAENTGRMADSLEKAVFALKTSGGSMLGTVIGAFINALIFVGMFAFFNRKSGKGGGNGGNGSSGAPIDDFSGKVKSADKPTTQFTDVAGIDDALVEVQEVVEFLKNPEKFRSLGGSIPKGILLEGQPGTGKTLLARALAGEANAGFFAASGSDFVELYVGMGAHHVRALFAGARAYAAKTGKPAIVFIDEIDAVGKTRGAGPGGGGDQEHAQTINALLAEMDGFGTNSKVIVLAATNLAEQLDPALKRPGRFDRSIHVGLPDVLGREAILQIHARKSRLAPDADLRFVARRTAGLSGAYMENIVKEAANLAARGHAAAVGKVHLNDAIDRVIAGQTRNLLISPEVKKRTAYHETGHVLAGLFSGGKVPHTVTVIPHGGQALGFTAPAEEDDVYLQTKADLEHQLVGLLGGLVAEEMIYGKGKISTGPGDDLMKANRIAWAMVTRLAMSEKMGLLMPRNPADPASAGSLSEETKIAMEGEVKRILGEAQAKAVKILTERRQTLEAMTKALEEKDTLTDDEIEALVKATTPAKSA